MMIRDVQIDPPLMLAPMEGVTDITFRRLVREIGGCGMTFTEFIPAKSIHLNTKVAREMAKIDPDERPVCIQIYGNDPQIMGEAARIVADLGPSVVDLNMGCPSKKVCKNSGGSALMKDPALSRQIIRSIRAAIDLPFTVKMRAGWDTDNRNAPEIAQMCEEEGVEALAVHWRTRTDLYGGVRELDTIRAVKDRVSIPVSANGDIVDAESALDTLAKTGCDGLMIGRGAIRNPWVFREIEAALAGRPWTPPTHEDKRRVLLGYFESIRTRFGKDHASLGRFKKIARYFTQGVPFGQELRQGVFHSQSVSEAVTVVHGFFDKLEDWEAGRQTTFLDRATPELSRVLV